MWVRIVRLNLLIVAVLVGMPVILSGCTVMLSPESSPAVGTPEAAAGQTAAPDPLTAHMRRWQNMQAQQQSSNPMPMAEMMGQMGALIGEMQNMLASQPDAGVRQTMMAMLGEMMAMAQQMMAQMQTLPAEQQQEPISQMMALMGQMMALMGQLQGATIGPMGATAPLTGMLPITGMMPITGTMPMDPAAIATMMANMMQMFGQMHGMMGGVGVTMPLTHTMMMGQAGMGQMMGMMGLMMQMMAGHMGMMGAGMPITGTVPMGQGDMAQMMGVMGQMMQMMMEMHQTMMGGGMGPMAPSGIMTPTTPMTESIAPSPAPLESDVLTQSFQAGNVTVSARPLNLGTAGAGTLDFQVALETHSGSLDFDMAELAVLRVGDMEVTASSWEAPGEGHHVGGILSFPIADADGKSILSDAPEVSLVIRNLLGVEEQVLTWPLAGSAMTDASLPFDAQFIDSMIEHHQGAIAMAKEAQVKAEHAELKQLADAIIAAQTEEIEQLTEWRAAWYPDLAPAEGIEMAMGDMMTGGDETVPFDQRFSEAMISHHQDAIEMAKEAQAKAEHEEIKRLASVIIAVQQAEIEHMQGWLTVGHE
jgi:uncharacterized protein (DUF305 family)